MTLKSILNLPQKYLCNNILVITVQFVSFSNIYLLVFSQNSGEKERMVLGKETRMVDVASTAQCVGE